MVRSKRSATKWSSLPRRTRPGSDMPATSTCTSADAPAARRFSGETVIGRGEVSSESRLMGHRRDAIAGVEL
jgi:hypothetical protein